MNRGSGSGWLDALDRHRAEGADQVEAFVAVHEGAVIAERYYGGVGRDLVWPSAENPTSTVHLGDEYPVAENASQVHNIKSVTKSVLATTVGIALDRGDLPSLHLRASELLPEYFDGVDQGKEDIRLADLLAMRSGLAWEENGPSTHEWLTATDLIGFTTRNLPLIAPPGRVWNYSTADSHLLSACLTVALGQPVEEYARKHLFEPLGWDRPRWSRDPQGRVVGGSELFLTPRQMASFGRMIMAGGVHDGTRLVSPSWVSRMLAPQVDVDASLLLRDAASRGMEWPAELPVRRVGYAQQWWSCQVAGRIVPTAVGVGGQLIVLLDDLDLVCVQLSTLTRDIPMDEVAPRINAAMELVEICVDAVEAGAAAPSGVRA